MNITELKDELKLVSNVADKIKSVHGLVAERCGISNVYSQKIRNEKGAKTDNEEIVVGAGLAPCPKRS